MADLMGLTKAELLSMAEQQGIDVSESATKAEIVEALGGEGGAEGHGEPRAPAGVRTDDQGNPILDGNGDPVRDPW